MGVTASSSTRSISGEQRARIDSENTARRRRTSERCSRDSCNAMRWRAGANRVVSTGSVAAIRRESTRFAACPDRGPRAGLKLRGQ
ncbi:hypothetical protein LC55x_3087 [Lysobacter capsici]|nr:hypothetical protein LC55x_3087 [Lysobacter capsici]